MFTLENTARATHVRYNPADSVVMFTFYDLSDVNAKFMNTGEWMVSCLTKKEVLALSCIIELSRPQSDIANLFESAPEWATGYGKLNKFKIKSKYWLCADGFSFIEDDIGTILNAFDEEGIDDEGIEYQNFSESDFTVVATRPEVAAIESKATPSMYTPDQQWMLDNMKEWGSDDCGYVTKSSSNTVPLYYRATKPCILSYITREQWENRQAPTLPTVKANNPAIDTPVFTQAMADAGELPPVGVDCLVCLPGNDDWFEFRPDYFGDTYVIGYWFEPCREASFGISALKFKPLDTRTDEQKACDDLAKVTRMRTDGIMIKKVINALMSGNIHGIKWVGK